MKKLRHLLLAVGAALAIAPAGAPSAKAQIDPYIGQLMLVGYTYCPRGWADANGQLLAINSNQALFALYGTTFGGDGRTTFGLPDLRGRAAIGLGQGPGLPDYALGAKGGAVDFVVTTANMPSHSHSVHATNQNADKPGPGSDLLGRNVGDPQYHDGPGNVQMDPAMIGNTGSGQAIQKRSPFLAMRWCVALVGTFPPQN